MRRSRVAAGACAIALASWASVLAGSAHAWTEARVESAGAHLDVAADGSARVNLRIGVRVLGGWLSRLELAGLDPGLVLDVDKPPSLLSEDGQKLVPQVRIERNGRVVIGFAGRAQAPHRGRHDLLLRYTTRLASETSRDGGRTLRWSLPAFSADLRDVDLWVSAPAGTSAIDPSDGAVTLTQLARGAHSILHWQRAQLPRTLVFEAALHLPPAVVRDLARSQQQEERAPLQTHAASWAALCLLLLVTVKRMAVRASSSAAHAHAWPLLGLRGRARAIASIALAGAAAWLYPFQPWLGATALVSLSACALDRGFGRTPQRPQRWTRARYVLELARLRRLRAARLLGAAAWLDATTPLGFSLLAACYALLLQRAALGADLDVWLEALLAATPLWLSATRFALPKTPLEEQIAQQARARADSREQPFRPAGADRPALDRAA